MIRKNNKDATGIYFQNRVIQAVYQGARLVWQLIRSCYGTGIWLQERPWIDTDLWKNDK